MPDAIPFRTAMNFTYGEPRALHPQVRRLVAPNPSPFTFKGTNTYIVSAAPGGADPTDTDVTPTPLTSDDEVALIDPGPQDDAHFDATMAALGSARLTHIFITHTHRDHTDGMARLAQATGAETCGMGRKDLVTPGAEEGPSGGEFVEAAWRPDHRLDDGERVAGKGWALSALHTPGHAPDHLCFALEGTKVLFSGDHVMSWNTSVVAPPEGHMGDYLQALERLLQRDDEVFFPGHGGQLTTPQRVVKAFIVHRHWRESAIHGAIKKGRHTVDAIVEQVYAGIDPKLKRAAGLSVLAHVHHLMERGLVNCDGDASVDGVYRA
ncbi:MAG: MBL fold metallo-hydrolase [Pseudomonadota bacterium]